MVQAVVVGANTGYRMYDVARLDATGAQLTGPILLEVGEELTLRLSRDGGAELEVRAKVTSVARGGEPGLRVTFVDVAPERLAPLLT